MDTRQKYLNGDVDFLGNVDKIIPRKMELPLLMQTKIQIRKNMFGIRSRLFRHMKSYDYKFRSLAAEPKQVIRALRPRVTIKSVSKHPKISNSDRFTADKSSEWKLPPNVYNLCDFTKSLKKMGKRGLYQCFTVERDDKTVKNHHAPKPDVERCETDFYDLPSYLNDGMKPLNFYKNRFLKAPRFEDIKDDEIPPPTKYFPQNFSIKPTTIVAACGKRKSSKVQLSEVIPIFYYPHTTVPMRKMEFYRENNTPEPGRYNLHNLSCQCLLVGTKGSSLHKSFDKSRHFDPIKMTSDKKTADDISLLGKFHINREPISFRLKSSASCDDLFTSSIQREIRYNTMIKKKNLFSSKTGRPVGFLTAAPRFEKTTEKPIKLYKKMKSKKQKESVAATAKDDGEASEVKIEIEKTSTDSAADKTATTARKTDSKPKIKWQGMTKKRLDELATPKTAPLQINTSDKVQVFTKAPAFSFRHLAENVRPFKKVSAFADIDIRRLREVVQKEQEQVVGIQENNIFVSDK